jgi:hypothetical protein
MKKLLLFVLSFSLTAVTFAQENPCATVTNIRLDSTGTGGPYTIKMTLKNDVSSPNPKGVLVIVSNLSNQATSSCFISTNIPGQKETSSFTMPRANIRVRIVRYTASNGNCQGGTCSPDMFWDPESNIPLPVNFKSFNANRNKSNVGLVWETSTESNNKGFEIQRKIGANNFETIAFVNSKAIAGNSETNLTYSYTDVNASQGVSHYRLLQVDFDGQSKHSDIRSVRAEEQSSAKTIVYPNPSSNGKVNVVFEDTRSIRDIQLMDMNGRVVNQWRNQTGNNIQIDNLVPGFYNLRIVDQATKEQSVEKIIIRKN